MGPNLTVAEGFVLGVAAKMFAIAGPVIVYGLGARVVYGLIYWITMLLHPTTVRPEEFLSVGGADCNEIGSGG